MRTQAISYAHWQRFFDEFSHLHQGEHVNVETMLQGDRGVKSELRDAPLVGIISARPKSGEDELIEVIARESPDGHATHSIERPTSVRLAEEENGQAVAIQIESAGGDITMIRFEPPIENMPEGFTVA